jgi:hypothetical protein
LQAVIVAAAIDKTRRGDILGGLREEGAASDEGVWRRRLQCPRQPCNLRRIASRMLNAPPMAPQQLQNMLTSSNRIRPHAHMPAQSGSRPSIYASVDQRLSQSAVVCSAPPRHPTPVCWFWFWCWYAHMSSSTPRCLTRDTARRRCAERLQLLSSGQLHHGRAWIG